MANPAFALGSKEKILTKTKVLTLRSALARGEQGPTASAFSDEDFDMYRRTGGDIGIRKMFQFGLESQVSFEANRSMNNSSVDGILLNHCFGILEQRLIQRICVWIKMWCQLDSRRKPWATN